MARTSAATWRLQAARMRSTLTLTLTLILTLTLTQAAHMRST